jgi:molybdate transport system substrate-binding protein
MIVAIAIVALSVGGYAGYYYTGNQTAIQTQTLTASVTQTQILTATSTEKPTELRVFVAASLNALVTENVEPFQTDNNVKLLFNAGGSDALYAQIFAGSPADVYMAADFKWLNQLKANKLLYGGKYWNFTTNHLVVMLPSDNPKNIVSLQDLVKPGVRIVIAGWTVPAGKYTNTTLNKIDSTWGNPASPKYKGPEWENYKARFVQNIISYESTVEQVVGKVVLGNCDAGVAYISDAATGGSKLKQIQIPAEVNTIGTYGMGLVNGSSHPELAIRYVNFWLSNEGQALLAKYGFGQPLTATVAGALGRAVTIPTNLHDVVIPHLTSTQVIHILGAQSQLMPVEKMSRRSPMLLE